jgi:hypothetical protein
MANLKPDIAEQVGFVLMNTAQAPAQPIEPEVLPAPAQPPAIMPAESPLANASAGLDGPLGPSFDQPGIARAPYLILFHKMMERADDMQAQLGALRNGEAIIVDNDVYIRLTDWKFSVLLNTMYWCDFDKETFEESGHTFKEPPRTAGMDSRTLTLMLIDDGRDFYATVSTFKNWTKAPIVASHLRKLGIAYKPEWVTKAPDDATRNERATIVQATHGCEYYRLWGKVTTRDRQMKNDKGKYLTFDSTSFPATLNQLARLTTWLQGEGVEALNLARQKFLESLTYVQGLVAQ